MGAFDLIADDFMRVLNELQYSAQMEEKVEDASNALDLKAQAAGVPIQIQTGSAEPNGRAHLEITFSETDKTFLHDVLDEVFGAGVDNG